MCVHTCAYEILARNYFVSTCIIGRWTRALGWMLKRIRLRACDFFRMLNGPINRVRGLCPWIFFFSSPLFFFHSIKRISLESAREKSGVEFAWHRSHRRGEPLSVRNGVADYSCLQGCRFYASELRRHGGSNEGFQWFFKISESLESREGYA